MFVALVSDNEYCGDGKAVRCSVVKGAMTFHGDIDKCTASNIIRDFNYYNEVDGVTNAQYRNSDEDACGFIIAGAAAAAQPPEDDSISAAAAFGMLFAGAALVALAFLAARKLRRRKPVEEEVAQEDDDMSLISNDLDEDFLGCVPCDDPYANTIDVHKCTSIYCNICNSGGQETNFLPAPKKVDMAKTMADVLSPTAVNMAHGAFDEDPEFEDPRGGPELQRAATNTSVRSDAPTVRQGSIMRVPIQSQIQRDGDRPLTPVNEVAHDSEIDTEMESLVISDDEASDVDESMLNDESTIPPPPPPLAFHPDYLPPMDLNDETSI